MKIQVEVNEKALEHVDLFRGAAAIMRGGAVDLKRLTGTLAFYGETGPGPGITITAIRQSLADIIRGQEEAAAEFEETADALDDRVTQQIVDSCQPVDDPSPTLIVVNPQLQPGAFEGILGLLLIAGLIVALVLGAHQLKRWHEQVTTPYAHFAESYVSAEAGRG